MSRESHICKGASFIAGTQIATGVCVATGDLPLILRRVPGTTAIEATIGREQVLLTGPQVARFWEMVQKVRDDLPYQLREK